jgi:hypothetical protein
VRAGDIAAKAAERLGERPFDHVDPAHGAIALADAAAARSVHADGVHFVDIGHRAVTFGEIADAVDRRGIAVHGIEALEHDQLGPAGIGRSEQLFEVGHIVVTENLLLAVRLAHALDHRIVIPGIRQDEAVRHLPREGGDSGLVGDVARSEYEGRFLAVQVGEFALEFDERVIGAGNIAGAAGAGSHPRRGLDHGADHFGVLAHAEVVVRAPDHDVARAVWRMPYRVRKASSDAFEIGKDPVAPLVPQAGQSGGEIIPVVHSSPPPGDRNARGRLFRGVPSGLSRRSLA